MASAEFARIEGRPMGKYASGKDTNAQLAKLAHQLSVIKRLKAFAVSAKYIIEKNDNDTNYFLLELAENTINITKYKLSEFDRATAAYLQKEKESKSDSATDVVLVAAESMYALQNAYPNYFADSTEFVQLMEKALAESV